MGFPDSWGAMSWIVEFDNYIGKWEKLTSGIASGSYSSESIALLHANDRATAYGVPYSRYRVRDTSVPVQTVDAPGFVVKDSGKRDTLSGGMVRDTTDGKTDYTLITDGPMFTRWAEHLTKGARKYDKRNWMKCADGDKAAKEKVLERFRESAFRHFVMWMNGADDEDHAAGVFFNLNGYEYLKATMEKS